MTAPSFVNSGTEASQGFGTSVTPSLPGSRTNGNILIAVWMSGLAAGKVPNWPADWSQINLKNDKISMSYAYRFVDGTETAPTITWSGATSAHAYIMQYTGAYNGAGAIGFFSENHNTSANTLMTSSGLTTDTGATDSTVICIIGNSNNTFTLGQAPSGYTAVVDSTNDEVGDVVVATGGNTSPAVSQSVSISAFWQVHLFELRSTATSIAVPGSNSALGASMSVLFGNELDLSPPAFDLGVSEALQNGFLSTAPTRDILISWLRRDRIDIGALFVTSNVPMSEAEEKYDVELIAAGSVVRTFTGVTTNSVLYTGAMQQADGWTYPPSQLIVKVYQISAVVGRGFGTEVIVDVE